MRERPIIMGPESVRAILAGRKTQTRRVAPFDRSASVVSLSRETRLWGSWSGVEDDILSPVDIDVRCRYGVPGDRLWVKERFFIDDYRTVRGPLPRVPEREFLKNIYYRADGDCCEQIRDCCCASVGKPAWRSPLFMPRWASRLTLKVVSVRVQRLQQISEEDARAEGVYWSDGRPESGSGTDTEARFDALDAFPCLWDEINGRRPGCAWGGNPWVWAIEFRVAPPGAGRDA